MTRTRINRKRPGPPRRGPAGIPPERWRNKAYLHFVRHENRCVVHGTRPPEGCDPMHSKPNGLSSKGPDAEAIPGCRACHEEQTAIGWEAWQERHGIDREAEAARCWARFQERKARK